MSVKSVVPQTTLVSNPPEAGPVNEYWKSRMTVNSSSGLTNVEMTRLFTRLAGIGVVGTGLTTFSLAALGLVSWPVGLIVIPCAVVAGGLIWYNYKMNDYENPDELEKFRSDAKRMSLESVVQAYGWNDMLRFGILTPDQFALKYRQQLQGMNLIEIISLYEKTMRHISQCTSAKFEYQVPSPRESARQWRQETAIKTFEEIIQTYPLDKLEQYGIIEHSELSTIKNLKREYEAIKAHCDQQVFQIEKEFQDNTGVPKSAYDAECARADQMYKENYAVKELQGFDFRYTRERQAVHEQQNRSKVEARAHFDCAVAPLTNHGLITYSNLPAWDKARYDQLKLELELKENQADSTACLQIEQINKQSHERRILLDSEEVRVKNLRVQMIEEAKRRYDADVNGSQLRKEERLRPIEASFRSSANDFHGRYRAYLRLIGAK